jgi:Aldo/keto reductase family
VTPEERIQLGTTRLHVTRVGLGTAALGGLYAPVDEEQAVATLRRAHDCALRLFDTAPLYGHGLAERRVGIALLGVPRDEVVLATKLGRLLRADVPPDRSQLSGGFERWPAAPPVNPVFDFSYDGVLRCVEESLERLGLDRVDVLHIHDPDEHEEEALTGAYRALDRLRSEGTISAGGGIGSRTTCRVLRHRLTPDADDQPARAACEKIAACSTSTGHQTPDGPRSAKTPANSCRTPANPRPSGSAIDASNAGRSVSGSPGQSGSSRPSPPRASVSAISRNADSG